MESPPPLDSRREALGLCRSYVTSVVRAELFDPSTVPALTDGSEGVYPGLSSVVEQVGRRLRDRQVTLPEFDSQVTFHVDIVDAYCVGIYGASR